MSDFFGKLKSGAGKVAFEADKMSRQSRAQGELSQIKRQMETQFMKLGELVYRQHVNQEGESPAVAEICNIVADLELQIAAKGEEIQRINAETYGQQGSAPAPAPTPAPEPFQPFQSQPPAPTQIEPMPGPVMTPPTPSATGDSMWSLPTEPVPPASPEATASSEAPAPTAQTKFCPNCGREMPLVVKFCPDCGTKMA